MNNPKIPDENNAPKPEQAATVTEGAVRCCAWLGRVFDLEYSLKYPRVTKYTTDLGYFHGMKLRIFARDVNEAVETLRIIHDDGIPEAIKSTDIGQCVHRPNDEAQQQGGGQTP